MKDYYEILRVSRFASMEEIEAAYATLLSENKFKEQGDSKENAAKFKEIGEAYLTLSDLPKKKIYDRQLMDYDAERVWNKRQFESSAKKKSYIQKAAFWKRLKMVAGIIVIGAALIAGTYWGYNKFFAKKTYVLDRDQYIIYDAKNNTGQAANLGSETKNEEVEESSDANGASGKETPQPADTSPPARSSNQVSENRVRSNEPQREEKVEPVKTPAPAPNTRATPARNSASQPRLNSLEDYFSALGNENLSYEEKNAMVDEALQFFDNKNANVLIYGPNNVQTGREAISNYLLIVMIQNYKVSIMDLKKGNDGKITQISVKESI